MTDQSAPITVNVNDAARMIGVGRTYIYRLINERRIDAVRLGGRTLIRVESLRHFAASLPSV